MNSSGPHPLRRLLPWLLAVLIGFATLWQFGKNRLLQAELESLRTATRLSEIAEKLAQSQLRERSLLAESMINRLGRQLDGQNDLIRLKIIPLLPPPGNISPARGTVVWDAGQQAGLLSLTGFPALPAGRHYQLWIHDPAQPRPINGGLVPPASVGETTFNFKPDQPVPISAQFQLSIITPGTAAQADDAIVLIGP